MEFKTRHTNIMCRSPWEAMGGGDFKRNSLGLIEVWIFPLEAMGGGDSNMYFLDPIGGRDVSMGGHGRPWEVEIIIGTFYIP